MDLKHIFEHIQFELLLEGLGGIFGFHILWQLLFNQKLQALLSSFITTIC